MQNQLTPTEHNNLIVPLLTDNYQITMAYTYFLHGRHNDNSVFEAFFRKCPFGTKQNPGQYAIFAGLEEVLKFLANFKFSESDIEFLKEQMPQAKQEFFDYLLSLNIDNLKVQAIQEGSLVFPNEPLIVLEGPLALIQLIETPILNLLNFPTLIATNANRMKQEAGQNKICMEFGLRRAQGPDGGMTASQYSYLGGFDGTSNVLAGKKFGIPISGTMAHSFVTSYRNLDQVEEFELNGIKFKENVLNIRKKLDFDNTQDGELASFIAYAQAFPQNFVCLVDTYNVLESGIPNFLIVAAILDKAGYKPKGIRLDSGDLAYQSIEGKKLFQKVGQILNIDTSKYIVVASNDINEDSLKLLKQNNHQIDAFGIGTQLVTCSKQPALGMVYKLVSLNGDPKHKIVQTEPEKSTLPGKKTIYRIWLENNEWPSLDIICKDNEKLEPGKLIHCVNKSNSMDRYSITPKRVEKILVDFIQDGKLVQSVRNLHEARKYGKQQKQNFNQEILDNDKPKKYKILLSEEYFQFFQQCSEKLIVYKNDI